MTAPTDNRLRNGRSLLTVAVLAVLVSIILWQKAGQDAESDQRTENYAAIFEDRPTEDIEPDRTPALALGALGGVLFLGGVILIAGAPATEDPAD